MMEINPEIIEFIDVDFSEPTVLNKKCHRLRRCPVIVTLGDSRVTSVDLQKILEAGMNVAKLKTTTCTRGDKINLLNKMNEASEALCQKFGVSHWPVATCIELKTCVVKTGLMEHDVDSINITEGDTILMNCIVSDYNKCNKHKIFVDNPYLTIDTKIGTEISIAADEIILKCTGVVDDKTLKCVVTKGGVLKSLLNVCARGMKHSRPRITKRDLHIVNFCLEYRIDLIIINYVRHVKTVTKIKQYIGKNRDRPIILGGICTQEGLDNFDDILKEVDGIILARDLLPYELESSKRYKLPAIQKWMIGKCLQAGKPLYISGGVFDEALTSGNFLHNEIMDISNAILDGASGFIIKDYHDIDALLEVLKALNEISHTVEPFAVSKSGFNRIVNEIKMPVNAAEAAMISCAIAANQCNARIIIIPTVSGKTVQTLHLMKLSAIILTVSTKPRVLRLLRVYRGVTPLMYTNTAKDDWKSALEARIDYALEYAVKRSWVGYGDLYVTLQKGSESSLYCDTVRVWKVTISKKSLVECPTDCPPDCKLNETMQ